MIPAPRFLRIVALAFLAGAAGAAEPLSHPLFRPVVRPAVPPVHGVARTDIDRFLLAALETRGLAMNPEADRVTLLRRVHFGLTGLPPSAAEVDAFSADPAPDAYERLVERLLASPHYGECWGKFWLDAAGYADSNGYFNADSDRPLAWRYRDYVLRSFNTDKPYDQFVREQLAGDELVDFSVGGDVTPRQAEALTATHFLRNAPDGTGESDGNPEEVRTDRFTVLEGNLQNLMNCLLGLTAQCARCHDHKFEPLTQVEYYRLQAFLFPVYNPERWKKPNERVVEVGTRAEREARRRLNDQVERQVRALRTGLTAFAKPLREQLLDERLRGLDTAKREAILAAVWEPTESRTPAQQALLREHAAAVEVGDDTLARRFPEFAALRERVNATITEREKDRPKPTDVIAAYFVTDPQPPPHHVLKRGQHGQPGEVVAPGVPAALCSSTNPAPAPTGPGRRTALARWLTSPEHPLLARVLVNRVWQHHFGTGIVATPDNLGASGAKPSHPELLDFLAAEFVASGWSVKTLHRHILRSAAYRQSSTPRPELSAVDPDNRLLARFPVRRLDAEAVRDAMLNAAGELDLRCGGPYVPSRRIAEGSVDVDEKADGARRRSVYLQQRRTQVVTFLQLFDAPSIVSTCGKRSPSTVPLQSLALLNSDFARARGQALAAQLAQTGGDDAGRIALAFRRTCGRPPSAEEAAACTAFLDRQRAAYPPERDPTARSWADLCQMLFAGNAFLYVE